MPLVENTLFGVDNKVQRVIGRLREFCPPDGYWLGFSGGKDSVVLLDLAKRSGVKFDAHYSVTTIDPPELVRFIRREHPEVEWIHPERPFLRVLEEKGFPQRHRRWCCELYKENGGNGRTVLTGIRWAESYNRSRRRMIEPCMGGGYKSKNKWYVNPIIDWSTEDVWEYIRTNGVSYCELYDQGYTRIGCLMCPFASHKARLRDAERYPRYQAAYIRAFERLYATGRESMKRWASGEEMFWWWLREDCESDAVGQKMLFE